MRLEEPDRQAIAWSEMYTPVRAGVPVAGLLDLGSAARTIASFLAPAQLSRVEQVFDAASFTAAQAKALGVKRSEPAMRVLRRYRDANGRLLMLAISLHPPGRFAYSMALAQRLTLKAPRRTDQRGAARHPVSAGTTAPAPWAEVPAASSGGIQRG